MKYTYAIGWRHHKDRESNLSRVLDWLRSFPELDVLVVEQDNMKRFEPPRGVRHVFLRSTKAYNRSWGFNVAYKESDSPVIIFGDSDIIMRGGELRASLDAMEGLDVVSPYSSVIDLTKNESELSMDEMFQVSRPGRGEADIQRTNLCGGVVMFSRSSFESVGGWDERFLGWGGEDDMMSFKVAAAGLKSASMPFRSYHLWHPKAPLDVELYGANLGLLRAATAKGGAEVLAEARSFFLGSKKRG